MGCSYKYGPRTKVIKKIKKKGNYIAFYVYSSTHSAIRFEIESLIYV